MASGIYRLPQIVEKQLDGSWPTLWYDPPGLKVFGYNINGELGLGDTIHRSSPVQVGTLNDWQAIATMSVESVHTLAVKTNGTLWAWGRNSAGSLGLGTTISESSPVQVGALTNWSSVISSGSGSSAAIKTDGTLWTWGGNGYGYLGLGNMTSKSSPTQVGTSTDWATVEMSDNFTVAIKTDGTFWSWGYNRQGQLGSGATTVHRSSPAQVGALTDWLRVSPGWQYTLASKTDGTLWSWGYNNHGECGQNNKVQSSSPVKVGLLTNWSATVSAGANASAALKANGALWVWGRGTNGVLGNGTTTLDNLSPIQIGSLTDWSTVHSGQAGMQAIKTDGTLWSWGVNNYGQLGTGDTIYRSSPIQVGLRTYWTSVRSGYFNVLGLAS
jgi:alpha-tubulin suppressor-like RCC1 family protein